MSESTAAESPENETQPRQKTRAIILRTAAAVGAAALLFLLDGAANQHEWAVGWLRRYEKFSPFTLLALISLERLAVAFVLFLPFAVIDKLRKAPEEPKKPEKSLLRKCIVDPIQSTLLYAAPILVMKLAGAGMGTQALAAACVFTAAKCKKPKFLLMVAPSLYMGFAFAHWANSSWLLAIGMTTFAAAVIQYTTFRMLFLSAVNSVGMLIMTPIEAVKRWRSFAAAVLVGGLCIWSGAGGWLVEWFQGRYAEYSPWPFCLLISLEGNAASVPFWFLANFAVIFIGGRTKPKRGKKPKKDRKDGNETNEKPKKDRKDENKTDGKPKNDKKEEIEFTHDKAFYLPMVFAPIGETLFFQALPIALLSAAGFSAGTQFIVSAALFAWAHYVDHVGKGVGAGIPGGVYLGYPFVRWYPDSLWRAFWITAVSHSLHNLFAVIADKTPIYRKIDRAVDRFAERLKRRMLGGKKDEPREE